MKKVLSLLFVFLVLVSCEEDPFNAFLKKENFGPLPRDILDGYIPSVNFIFEVTDAQGNNLFNESTSGNWLSKSFSATFEGKEFLWPDDQIEAYIPAHPLPRGFFRNNSYLFFGRLDEEETWNTDLCISWPDGSKDRIRVQHAFRWTKEGNTESYTGFKVNGVPVEGDIIHLTKKKS